MDEASGIRLKLRFKEVVSYLKLPSNKGMDVNLWDFKQRKNLVIIFHHGRSCMNCRNKLKELSKVYGEIQALEAEVVAVSFDNLRDSEI
ncbi:MAG: redoxin domain-containing protein [Candidatus Bathyarchaeia archaeon]